ncbi:MAG: NAD(P)-binding domain-containing protein, partial [Flavobacterium sp.]|nr:NAD(P)-binding domain-containing protein [Flavobacterium sp.]
MSDKLTRPLLLAGCGKMGSAMLSGWLESGIVGGGVVAVEPMGAPSEFANAGNVQVIASADELAADFDPEVVVFAVKPQQMDAVAPAYKRFAGGDTAFLSIAAGKNIDYFTSQLGSDAAIVR